jgi:hypothetical protein
MGMFDTITIEYPLPGENPYGYKEFQTKDLDCVLDHYTVDADGQLWRAVRLSSDSTASLEQDFTGTINCYTSNFAAWAYGHVFTPEGEDLVNVDYRIIFDMGRLVTIEQTAIKRESALPSSALRGIGVRSDDDDGGEYLQSMKKHFDEELVKWQARQTI